jgi:hypothetical protein
MNAVPPAPTAEAPLTVACLCAQWCRTCDGYREVFDQVLLAVGQMGVQGMWVDVEDHADATLARAPIGELEVVALGSEPKCVGSLSSDGVDCSSMVGAILPSSYKGTSPPQSPRKGPRPTEGQAAVYSRISGAAPAAGAGALRARPHARTRPGARAGTRCIVRSNGCCDAYRPTSQLN